MRGNESFGEEFNTKRSKFVPHMWECIDITSGAKGYFSGCSTHVGMDRLHHDNFVRRIRLSHARGNGSIPSLISWLSHASVPLTWEWIKAWNWIERRWLWSFHMGGNESGKVTFGTIFSKFVPHAWEWVDQIDSVFAVQEVYPTRVGMNRAWHHPIRIRKGLSHTSGNESVSVVRCLSLFQFVPREWEWAVSNGLHYLIFRVYPTWVGVSHSHDWKFVDFLSLFHTRGNESLNRENILKQHVVSHSRGSSQSEKAHGTTTVRLQLNKKCANGSAIRQTHFLWFL